MTPRAPRFARRPGAWLLAAALAACGGARPEPDEPASAADRAPATTAPQVAPVARVQSAADWLDLLAQRPSALVMRHGRLVVEPGRPQSRVHLELRHGGSFRLGARVDERAVGLLVRRAGTLEIPLDGDLAPALHPDVSQEGGEPRPGLAMALTWRALAPKQLVTVVWNGRPLANLQVGTAWERRTFSLPADLVRPGENRLRLHVRRVDTWQGEPAALAVERVEVGAHDDIVAGLPEPRPAPYLVEGGGADPVRLRIPAGVSLVWYLVPPRRGRLELALRGTGSVRVLGSLDEDHRQGRAPRELLFEPLRPTGGRHLVDLSGFGGQPLRLELRVGGEATDGARLDRMVVTLPRTIPLDRRDRKLRDLYVFAVEGARGDSIFALGRRSPHPAFDRFAADALVFARAQAVGAWAVPNHAAWMTSVPPPVHKTVRGTFVADAQDTVAEVLERVGYDSLLVTANPDVGDLRGLTQGFDRRLTLGGSADERHAQAVVQAAEGFLREAGAAEHLRMADLVVNDPQAPYDPPRERVKDLVPPEGAPLPHMTHIWVGRVRMGKHEPSPEEVEYVRALYDAELAAVGQALDRLLDDLEKAGRLEDSVVVVVGMHGEEFLEHGGAGHGRTLYQESIHVPLAIRAPKVLVPGRVEAPVDLLDLAPTLADLLGVQPPRTWDGASLVPIIDDPQPPPRLVLSYLGDGSRAGRVGDHKIILGAGGSQAYFDLGADPGEQDDRVAEGGVALRVLRAALSWELHLEGRWKRARWGTGANLSPAFALDHGV